MGDNACMRETPQPTTLFVGDTVTSPLGDYQMKLVSDGLVVAPVNPPGAALYIAAVVNPYDCKLVGHSLVIQDRNANSLWTSPAVTFTVRGLAVQDDGTVDIYGTNGIDCYTLFSYNAEAPLALIEEAHLLSFGQAIEALGSRFDALVRSAPRVSHELLEEIERLRRQHGHDRHPPVKSDVPPRPLAEEPKASTGGKKK